MRRTSHSNYRNKENLQQILKCVDKLVRIYFNLYYKILMLESPQIYIYIYSIDCIKSLNTFSQIPS